MQTYMRVCPVCVQENNQLGKNDVAGWINWFKSEDMLTGNEKCPWGHDTLLVKKSMTCEEFKILRKVSLEPSFMESMNDLKEKDPIEFQLKLAQFKSTTVQQESIKPQKQNVPKCPTCGSTKLSKVSTMSKAGSVIMWGLFSQKVKKTWHCDNCKYEW